MSTRFSLSAVLSLGLLAASPAFAAPEITIEVGGESQPSGATLRLAHETLSDVTDSVHFSAPDGPVNVSFPNVVAGEYLGQVSFDEEIWSEVTSLLVHPGHGTLSFTHDPGPVMNVFYRLLRTIEPSVEITIRNTGDMPLTGIDASLAGPNAGDFTLDENGTATGLASGASTTLTVSFALADTEEHLAFLQIASNDSDENPFTLALVGDNDPGPIVVVLPVPTITVFRNRTTFETVIGPGQVTDDFSGAAPLFPVTTARGAISAGSWADIARAPEPSTIWHVPFGTTGWGGTWNLTVEGTGGGLAFELDFGGGNVVVVPGHLPPGSAAGQFFGFTSDLPFYGVRVRQFDSQGGTLQETHAFDDLTVPILLGGEIAAHDGTTTAAPQLADGQAAPLDFGTVARNSTATRTLTIANSGAEPLRVLALSTGGKFQIANAPALPFSLAPGGSANFDVTFASAIGGTFESRVDILSSDADETRFDFTVTAGVVIDAARLQLINTQNGAEVTDGQATVIAIQPNAFGGGSSVSLRMDNIGLDPLVLSAVSLPAGFQIFKTLPLTIPPGQSDVLSFTSVGPTAGFYGGDVILTTNSTGQATLTFPISALYNMPEISVGSAFFGSNELSNGGPLDVGTTRLGETRGFSLRVRSLHAGPLNVSGITLPAGYALDSPAPSFPFTLGKDQVRDVNFSIVSTAAGTFAGTLAIQNNDFDEGPFNLQLTGTVSPESIRFFGFSSAINEGGAINAFGVGSGPVTYAWDFDADGQFDDATGGTVMHPVSDGPAEFLASVRMTDNLTSLVRTQTVPVNNVPPLVDAPFTESILAGVPLVLNVSANDVVADVTAGMAWRVDWGDGNLDTTAAGHPAATSFSHAFSRLGPADIQIEATDKDGGTGSTFRSVWVHSAVIGVFEGPDTTGRELRDGQDSLSFTTAFGGTADRQITVRNRSGSSASIGPVMLPPGFALGAPPAFPLTLAPGATTTLTVRFSPLVPGSSGGELSLATSDPSLPSFEVNLSGQADAPDIAVSEFFSERFDFDSDTESFGISPGTESFSGRSFHFDSNDPQAPLIIQSITLPANFQLSPAPDFPLDFTSESSRDFRVQCTGVSTGFYEGWVTIVSNDPDENPFRFFVTSRVGSVADLLVKSDGSDLSSATGIILNGQSEALDASAPLSLRLHNQGNQSLTVSAITLPAGYAFASPPSFPINLSPFGSATLPDLLLTATAPGTYAGEVMIASTDPDENPYHFPVTATIPDGDPEPPGLSTFTLTPATPGASVVFSGTVTGPPNATVILEGSTDLGAVDAWTEITRVTLDTAGFGTIANAMPGGTTGLPRYFVRLRFAP